MEMVFVLLYINREAVVLPEKYPKTQCEALIKDFNGRCIPGPKYPCYILDKSRSIDVPCIIKNGIE